VQAFNDDLPYDQFVREQIAGDLIDPPRLDPHSGANRSVVGTGFWLLGEGIHAPVDIAQDEADRIDNRVDTFGKAFLGLALGCARCHDHKFDAVSGSLDRTVGGPSVEVYLTEFQQGRGRPKPGPLDGAGRRSLYVRVRRNFLPGFLLAFDAPVPFQAMGRRNVTNVPAQSLALMNDPFVAEQAARWARKAVADSARRRRAARRPGKLDRQSGTRLPDATEVPSLLDLAAEMAATKRAYGLEADYEPTAEFPPHRSGLCGGPLQNRDSGR